MTDSLQTARPKFTSNLTKKLDRLTGRLAVAVIDALGCVGGEFLHIDALRSTHSRAHGHNLDSVNYMKPKETWPGAGCSATY